jgi:hypothetical protein
MEGGGNCFCDRLWIIAPMNESLPKRQFRYKDLDDADYMAESNFNSPGVEVHEDNANVIASATDQPGVHMPVIDFDVPARLVPSSTPGHSHLYIDVPMSFDQMVAVLEALLHDPGIPEGYVKATKARGLVRKPGVKKAVAA